VGGDHVQRLVQILVGRRPADVVIFVPPGAVDEPAQHQQRLPEATQRPPPTSRAASAPLGG
jgi:hypothetical protein